MQLLICRTEPELKARIEEFLIERRKKATTLNKSEGDMPID